MPSPCALLCPPPGALHTTHGPRLIAPRGVVARPPGLQVATAAHTATGACCPPCGHFRCTHAFPPCIALPPSRCPVHHPRPPAGCPALAASRRVRHGPADGGFRWPDLCIHYPHGGSLYTLRCYGVYILQEKCYTASILSCPLARQPSSHAKCYILIYVLQIIYYLWACALLGTCENTVEAYCLNAKYTIRYGTMGLSIYVSMLYVSM